MSEAVCKKSINLSVNGCAFRCEVEARKLLVHLIRDDLDLTGTHIGCDTGTCGACTVIVDDVSMKSCSVLAIQADGAQVGTVEGLATDEQLTDLQQSFADHHALQCGYCTPGMLMSAMHLLRSNPNPTRTEIQRSLKGNICRCTGYWNIIDAIEAAARRRCTDGK